MICAVIDTNVIVSALITHNSAAATVAVVEHILSGDITPVYNEEILNEYDEVLIGLNSSCHTTIFGLYLITSKQLAYKRAA
jgi:predicted nucleic acid-binding protein